MNYNKFNLSSITSTYRGNLIIQSYKKWIKPKEKILDAGCGTGIIAEQIANNFEVKVIGCDIENYLIRKIPFKMMPSPTELPYPSKSFDVVMLNDALHHMTKTIQIEVIKECLRVGKKVLIFEVEPTIPGFIFDYVLNKIHYGSLATPLSFRDLKEWKKVFKDMQVITEEFKVKTVPIYPFAHIAICIKE